MDQWIYQCQGVGIGRGFSYKATNGFIGITANREIVLFDNQGREFERGPVDTAKVKVNGAFGNSIRLNGKRYALSFIPVTAGYIMGNALSYGAHGYATGETQRQRAIAAQFKDVVTRIQSGQPLQG